MAIYIAVRYNMKATFYWGQPSYGSVRICVFRNTSFHEMNIIVMTSFGGVIANACADIPLIASSLCMSHKVIGKALHIMTQSEMYAMCPILI